jgi:hypothetical protein
MRHSAPGRAGSIALGITLMTAQAWAQTGAAPGSPPVAPPGPAYPAPLPAPASPAPRLAPASPAPLPAASPGGPAAVPASPPPLASVLTGEANSEYQAAVLVYGVGDFATALLKFQRAYELSREGRLLWNMAVCEKNLRHYSRALRLVERYEQEARPMMTEQDRREASDLVNAIGSFVGQIWVTVDVPGATVSIDDEPVGTAPLATPVHTDIGPRRLRASMPGYLDHFETVRVAGRTDLRVWIKLERETHEGRISVTAEPGAGIYLDGQAVGIGRWAGTVVSGGHMLRVQATGKRTYQSEVLVRDKEARDLSVTLDPETSASNSMTWIALTGGVVLVTGAVIGGYLLLKPKDEAAPPPMVGTMQPGVVPLAIWR